jgi:hypothetical protein
VDLRTTLWYLGVPIRDVSYMFGDNESVINSSTQPHSKLHKRHNALSFHHVCKAIASGYIVLTYLPGKFNPADILSKHWGYKTIWPILPQAYLVLPWRYSRPHSRWRYWLDIPSTGIICKDICASTFLVIDHKLMGSDRNYTAMRTHVWWSVHLSALLITWGDG